MPLALILTATAAAALSGLPGLWLDRKRALGERIAAALLGGGALLGLAGAGLALGGAADRPVALPASFMGGGGAIGLDALSAVFLVPTFLVGALGSLYGLGYWRQSEHPANGRTLRLFWGLTVAGMATLLVARHALVFLLGWEVMALSAFLLIATEDEQAEPRRAAWIYLGATHLASLCLFALFSLWHSATGSYALAPLATHQASLGLLTAIFFLALTAFGLKAGIMPLHFWLPGAHASAPSHVSALFSGVMIKMGIYGLVRITGLLPDPPIAWGTVLLLLGAVSGVLGVVFAIGQHDLKRLLAYHSVENIGIIVMGLGLAMVGRSLGRTDWIVLGLSGCLLHVWNHALFKSLLFFAAGSVVHATGTRAIDRLGGLARPMPWTAALFLVGAVAICGLPPLNGFVSELLIYLGLLRSLDPTGGPSWTAAAAGVPVLAIIGALALACFVKVYGAVFLGTSRSEATTGAHEAPTTMILPMIVLAACCAGLGLAPFAAAPALDRAAAAWLGTDPGTGHRLGLLAPLATVGGLGAALLATAAGGWALLAARTRREPAARTVTWDCGYARPEPRMQYTSSSFAQMLVGLFGWVLRPHTAAPALRGPFPAPARFASHVDDIVLDAQILPAAAAAGRWLTAFRGMQRGLTQQYILYILVTVVVLMAATMPLGEMLARLFAR